MNPKAELWWAMVKRGTDKTYVLREVRQEADSLAQLMNKDVGEGSFTVEPVSVVRDGGKLAKEKG